MAFSDFARSQSLATAADRMSRQVLIGQIASIRRQTDRYYDGLAADFNVLEPDAIAEETAFPVFGVAIALTQQGEQPAFLVPEDSLNADIPGDGDGMRVVRATEAPSVIGRIRDIVDVDVPPSTVVIGVPEPVPHFATREGLTCIGNAGTLGARVTHRGTTAFLTAGHAAPSAGLPVKCQCGSPGLVAFSKHPAMVPALTITPDVAVVAPNLRMVRLSTGVQFSKTALLNGGDDAELLKASGSAIEGIMGYSNFLRVPSMSGMWGDTYFTLKGFSQPGDSGAPVVQAGTDFIAGHLVGASAGATSYIQSIDYQLAACQATLI